MAITHLMISKLHILSIGATLHRHFWRKHKLLLLWTTVALGLYYLFAPASYTVALDGKLVAIEMRRIDAKLGGEIISVRRLFEVGDLARVQFLRQQMKAQGAKSILDVKDA